jgi:membrane protein YqaA with SNARE-associated domain
MHHELRFVVDVRALGGIVWHDLPRRWAMSFLRQLSDYLLAFGIPGLFVVSLLDSAAVPLVGGPDGLVILLAWQKPAYFPWIVLAASLGSAIGCLVLYRIGRAGGDLALSRLASRKQVWVRKQVEENAFLAVFLSVILPPPFPTKPVILAAGLFRTPLPVFAAAVLVGRFLRYGAMAYLGYRFGEQAAQIIRSQYLTILAVLACFALLVLLTRKFLRTRRARIS